MHTSLHLSPSCPASEPLDALFTPTSTRCERKRKTNRNREDTYKDVVDTKEPPQHSFPLLCSAYTSMRSSLPPFHLSLSQVDHRHLPYSRKHIQHSALPAIQTRPRSCRFGWCIQRIPQVMTRCTSSLLPFVLPSLAFASFNPAPRAERLMVIVVTTFAHIIGTLSHG